MFGAVFLMFFLFEVGFRLSTPGFIENEVMDLMDFIKMGFFFSAFAMGFFIVALMNVVAGEVGASTDFRNIVSMSIWIWGVFFFATICGFFIYFLWWIPKKVKEAQVKSRKASEGFE
jgi:uncharacterized membrane protein YozB (DUF420 family)